jgi:hypothetical protein
VVVGGEGVVWCAAEVGGAAARLRLHLASIGFVPTALMRAWRR